LSSGLIGGRVQADARDFADDIAWSDHCIKFYVQHARGRDVLDIGCVMHNPENYKSRYWVHKALKLVARTLIGIDLYDEGVRYLRGLGFDIVTADAQDFAIGRQFDVIVAGDVIEHLEDLAGFISSCKRHLRTDGVILISTPNPWYWRNFVHAGIKSEFNSNPEHTLWFCPRTLRQLLNRHDLDIVSLSYGSRYLRDRLLPLPPGWKHTTFHAEVRCIAKDDPTR
jgi:2-polyprenyl-3-methyl-5-hydroxy-6-metoxy-1,4-benzoquinol methylase